MPLVSEAQRRKFHVLVREGKMKPSVLKQWEDETPKGVKLPERLHKKTAGKFKEIWAEMQERKTRNPWDMKQWAAKFADILSGGSGHTGVGKGNIAGQLEAPVREGPVSGSSPGGDPTTTDKTLLDRERNPRDFSPFSLGEEFTVESNPHIRY